MNSVVCIPVYDDWASALTLLTQLDAALAHLPGRVDVLFVDDGSNEPVPNLTQPPAQLGRVSILRLRRNLGHQRAIAIGLTHLYVHGQHDVVVVMDGDGEDRPENVPLLLERCAASGFSRVVFAQRSKRSEELSFRVGYALFKAVHVLLVGRRVEVGNFSAVPRAALSRLVAVSEMWNHYAAAVYQAKLPVELLPTTRAARIAGRSKMNLNGLIIHGLSAISVYSDIVGVRLLRAIGALCVLVLFGILTVIGVRFGTTLAIPGWATSTVGFLVVSLLNLSVLSTMMALFTLRSRAEYGFLPLRDFSHFVLEERVLHVRPVRPDTTAGS